RPESAGRHGPRIAAVREHRYRQVSPPPRPHPQPGSLLIHQPDPPPPHPLPAPRGAVAVHVAVDAPGDGFGTPDEIDVPPSVRGEADGCEGGPGPIEGLEVVRSLGEECEVPPARLGPEPQLTCPAAEGQDRKSTRLNS